MFMTVGFFKVFLYVLSSVSQGLDALGKYCPSHDIALEFYNPRNFREYVDTQIPI